MKKDQMVASRLPEELVRDLEFIERHEQTDRSATIRKLLRQAISEWKREFYARQYGEGKITLAKAAEQAGISLWEMMDYVRQQRIAAQYDLADLQKDLRTVLSEGGPAYDNLQRG